MSSSLRRELVILILQCLEEETMKETAHSLESESGVFVNMRYLEELVMNGEWDELDNYMSGFTKVDDNPHSNKIFFEIRKHKYLEALEKDDRTKAVEILNKDLKVVSTSNEDLFKEMTLLLTLENFRENGGQLSIYGDAMSARTALLTELKKLIVANHLLRYKLHLPRFNNSSLRTLNNQSCGQQRIIYPTVSQGQTLISSDDLPKTVVANLNQGSTVNSMDFHPVQHTLLLVGTNIGDIALWEVSSRERMVFRNFKVWDLPICPMTLQACLANEYAASVNRVSWSPDGTLFGVAYSKHIVHLYYYHGGDCLRNHLEIDAHIGNVSDLAFSHRSNSLLMITCGEDKTIKVSDPATGARRYTFEGHDTPVYSVCPRTKDNIEFIFSTSVDGNIKAWFYDSMVPRIDFYGPGHSCTTMACTSDGSRLFSSGTIREGESYIVEWDESEGFIKRTYHGLGKHSMGVVQFDTMKNRFLAAGDEFVIKFWDMDNANLLMTNHVEGGIPACPCIRFNKEGMLLAVSTSDNGVKILGNGEGVRLIRPMENRAL